MKKTSILDPEKRIEIGLNTNTFKLPIRTINSLEESGSRKDCYFITDVSYFLVASSQKVGTVANVLIVIALFLL